MLKVLTKNRGSLMVIITIVCALLGYTLTYSVIHNNIILQPEVPAVVMVPWNGQIHKLQIKEVAPLQSSDSLNWSGKVVFIPGDSVLFHQNPVFMVWVILILMMVATASGALPYFVWKIFELVKEFNLTKKHVILCFIFSVSVITALTLMPSLTPGYFNPDLIVDEFGILLRKGNILKLIVFATLLLEIPILISMFLIVPSADSIEIKQKDKSELDHNFNRINVLRTNLFTALQTMAVLVVFAALTSSTLSESIKATVAVDSFDLFPRQISYVYGLYFSVFLAIIYFPIHGILKYKKRALSLCFREQPDKDWSKKYLEVLSKEDSALENLRTAFTVMAPFISTFLPQLISG